MRDVAEAAQVSPSTVSRALRHDARIPVETRRRVEATAQRLGYRPNPMVSTLMRNIHGRRPSHQSPILACVHTSLPGQDWFAHPLIRRARQGALQRADALGYRLEEFYALDDAGQPRSGLSRTFFHRGIRGVLLAPSSYDTSPYQLAWKDFALATIGPSIREPRLHRSANNYAYGMRRLLNALLELGYRRLAYCFKGYVEHRIARESLATFLAHAWSPQAVTAEAQFLPPFDIDQGEQALQQFLQKEKPEILIGVGYWILPQLDALGLKVPDDIAFADVQLTRTDGETGGLYLDFEEYGAAAIDLVVEQINKNELGLPEKPRQLLLEPQYIAGRSFPRRPG